MVVHQPLQGLIRFLTVLISLIGQGATATPSINVALQASFPAPPFLLELLETAAGENSTCYFLLLDRIAEGRFADCSSDENLYQEFSQVLKEDGHITVADAFSSFEFAVSTHSAAPRIEAHYQYYETSIESSLMIAQDAACPVWAYFEGKQYCSPALDRAQQDLSRTESLETLPFDRVLGVGTDQVLPSILYADIASPLFGHFHSTLSATARNGGTSYRVRYRRQASEQRKPLVVNGYGAELALKRTDYIVIDDREASKEETEQSETTGQETSTTRDAAAVLEPLDEEMNDLKPLTARELSGLGMKTASFIMASEEPLDALIQVSQDFPKHSSIIAKRNASRELVAEHRHNRDAFLPAGYNVIWMNGQQVQSRSMDAFALLDQLRRERALARNLRNIGFTGSEAVQILSHKAIADSKIDAEAQRYDYRDDLEGGSIIIWLNDIEKDSRYSSWPSEASALLQRTWPGQLPQVRRDIHNVVIPVDLSSVQDIQMIVETLQTVVKRKIPIRFGVVPLLTTEPLESQAKLVYHLWDTYGLSAVFAYLESCVSSQKLATANKANFDASIKDRKLRRGRKSLDFQTILSGDAEGDQTTDSLTDETGVSVLSPRRLENTGKYLKRLGAGDLPAPYFVNGVAMPRNDAWLQAMSQRVDADLQTLQRQVYEAVIADDTWFAGQLLESASTYRNPLIVPEDEASIRVADIGVIHDEYRAIYERLPRINADYDKVGLERFAPSILVVTDICSSKGLALTREAVELKDTNGDVEIIFVHNSGSSESCSLAASLLSSSAGAGHGLSVAEVRSLLASNNSDHPAQTNAQEASRFWHECRGLVRALGLADQQQALLVNGRVVGPIDPSTSFDAQDFATLVQYERSKRLMPTEKALTALGYHDRLKSPTDSAILSSTIALSTVSDIPEGIFDSAPTLRMDTFEQWASDYTMIQVGDASSSSVHIVASIDPTSQVAQRWIPILKVLSELSGLYLKIYLNPREKMQELPIKRFYRHVLNAKPTFTGDGDLQGLGAEFNGVPKEALLNLALDVPPAWLVAPKESIHDLDNIKLSALKEDADVEALYELEYILIEGHSRDVTVGAPPRGVQLLLGTPKDPHFADTIIMANLGYFQFKANPGYWNLRLQPGRSSQIFTIDSAGQEGYNAVPGDRRTDITLMSFQGKTLYPRVSRNPGQEGEDVLEEGNTSLLKAGKAGSYLHKANKLASSLLSKAGLATTPPAHADINIFSVASGHLYERMLSIMMVSVMRHTEKTVKFWFISQFLSPSFKASLPTLAAHYGFEYELVTYKWPHWLRAQSEKQREIWGYKILFLDVLFPTSLEKVIFVDADQIVRADMNELNQLDLEGAPYGFTPMCDSRTEMEGFRFWKQGYWATFLKGLPYHISALYVVDLVKFREIAAGDRLRGQYHQLSADPASLSNLDQDLPNHMQHVLKIKSLPQDWLWCETWCSDEALKTAKTIDLCNNPQTKEPKLKRARRQVPEWTPYDEEIAGVLAQGKGLGSEVRGGVQEVMIEGTATPVAHKPPKSEETKIKDEL